MLYPRAHLGGLVLATRAVARVSPNSPRPCPLPLLPSLAGERKLFLLIEGPTEGHVKKAKAEIKKILEETTEKVMRRDAPAAGRYSVM
ncbi:hypothetical protein HYH03_000083 [Edaphochlamys debaryana]|uniref:Uncharacterized protein n=1 Tax=Edaphochlamys debaryana TaxID=47281 RepID=A0A835YI12_9CHLO|nr:hypothetical protein HYH03_000083 [Edaphochlamys debaryana]|eukprot:KAG2501578.1 hypothetical protein HYH03_000083 [Edaphochlamys debaryana]